MKQDRDLWIGSEAPGPKHAPYLPGRACERWTEREVETKAVSSTHVMLYLLATCAAAFAWSYVPAAQAKFVLAIDDKPTAYRPHDQDQVLDAPLSTGRYHISV